MRFMDLRSSRHLSHLQKLNSLISMSSALMNFLPTSPSARSLPLQNIFARSI